MLHFSRFALYRVFFWQQRDTQALSASSTSNLTICITNALGHHIIGCLDMVTSDWYGSNDPSGGAAHTCAGKEIIDDDKVGYPSDAIGRTSTSSNPCLRATIVSSASLILWAGLAAPCTSTSTGPHTVVIQRRSTLAAWLIDQRSG